MTISSTNPTGPRPIMKAITPPANRPANKPNTRCLA